ncbi:MAG: carboxypeptidase regulatory-like domain-containing protein [Myxococcota bacterium]
MPEGTTTSNIAGLISNADLETPIEGALVVLQCECLEGSLETTTNAQGAYSFKDLPEGNYTVQALAGSGNVSRMVRVSSPVRARVDMRMSDEPRVVT